MKDETPSFRALQGGLLVAPILQKLILNREPQRVADWVNTVSRWPFKRIIPCHFANDIKGSPADFQSAFSFLYAGSRRPAGRDGKGGQMDRGRNQANITQPPRARSQPSPSLFASFFPADPSPSSSPSFAALLWAGRNKERMVRRSTGPQPLQDDVQFLSDVSEQLTKQGVLYPEADLLTE